MPTAPKRIDWSGKEPEQSKAGLDMSSSSSSSDAIGAGASLLPRYKKKEDLEHSDWAGDGRGSGIINKCAGSGAATHIEVCIAGQSRRCMHC